jgi:hypothetical protein
VGVKKETKLDGLNLLYFFIFAKDIFFLKNDDYLNYEPHDKSSDSRGAESQTAITPFSLILFLLKK